MGRDGISNNDPLADKKYKGPGIFEQLGEDLLGLRRPLDCIQIEVTSNCTAHCIYCPHTTLGKNWKSRDMPPEVFAALWPVLRRSARAHLQGWGEPFLHPRFFDFVKFAQKAGCAVSTTSCGLYMDEENASKTANSGMDLIAFSLVGTDRASNNARAGADFEKVCASIKNLERALKQTGKPMEIHLAYLLLADRIEAIKKLPELMDSLDVDMAVISTLDYLALPEQVELAFYPDERQNQRSTGRSCKPRGGPGANDSFLPAITHATEIQGRLQGKYGKNPVCGRRRRYFPLRLSQCARQQNGGKNPGVRKRPERGTTHNMEKRGICRIPQKTA